MKLRGKEASVFSDLNPVRICRQKVITCLLFLLILTSLYPEQSSAAQSAITVTRDQVISDYPEMLTFEVMVRSAVDIQSITLIYSTNARTCQTSVAYQALDFEPASAVTAEWEMDFAQMGTIPPGGMINWQWEIADAAGNTLLTELQHYRVADTRYSWHSLSDGPITIQWISGTQAFGVALMNIATQALERLLEEAGISAPDQLWITVYPSAEEVREVAIHASEWAGGIAYPEYQSTILGIAPNELEWAEMIIPHELAHLVTDALVFNCRGVWLPTWLSEGLSMVAEGDQSSIYNESVLFALEAGDLPPLRTLTRGFSPYASDATRSYGQSNMVVTYMLETYGPEHMADLMAAIQSGMTTDEALQAVYQMDTDGLDSEWRISLGYPPQPTRAALNTTPTLVPTLALWTALVPPSETPSPTSTSTEVPTQTPIPDITQTVPESTDLTTTQQNPERTGNALVLCIGIITGGGLLLAFLVIVILLSRRRKT